VTQYVAFTLDMFTKPSRSGSLCHLAWSEGQWPVLLDCLTIWTNVICY